MLGHHNTLMALSINVPHISDTNNDEYFHEKRSFLSIRVHHVFKQQGTYIDKVDSIEMYGVVDSVYNEK